MHADWTRLTQLMDNFERTATPFINRADNLNPMAHPKITGPLQHSAQSVRKRTDEFWKQHAARIPVELTLSLKGFVEGRAPNGDPGAMIAFITEMHGMKAELAYALAAPELKLAEATERAFLHLQRLVIADPDQARRWRSAFDDGEPACERLGAVHLLHHGICAFKAHTPKDRTDLVLGERLALDEYELAGVKGLVLTEWKRVVDAKEAEEFVRQALTQAALYATGSLLGTELQSTRYLIMVSLDYLPALKSAIEQDDVTYRIANLAVQPSSPHRARIALQT